MSTPDQTEESQRMEKFVMGVRRLMDIYNIDITVIGSATPNTPHDSGFTSYGSIIRNRDTPVTEMLAMMDAIRSDIAKVYDETAKQIVREVKSSVDPQALAAVIEVLGGMEIEGTSLQSLGELAGDMVSAKKNEFLH